MSRVPAPGTRPASFEDEICVVEWFTDEDEIGGLERCCHPSFSLATVPSKEQPSSRRANFFLESVSPHSGSLFRPVGLSMFRWIYNGLLWP